MPSGYTGPARGVERGCGMSSGDRCPCLLSLPGRTLARDTEDAPRTAATAGGLAETPGGPDLQQAPDRAQLLRERAATLAEDVGPSPEATDWTPELEAWHAAFQRAFESLGELADWDAALLRAAAGPALDIGYRSLGGSLLITAAIRAERRVERPAESLEETSDRIARGALFAASIEERFRDRILQHDIADAPLEAIRTAREAIPLVARRLDRGPRVVSGVVLVPYRPLVTEAQKLLERAMEAAGR